MISSRQSATRFLGAGFCASESVSKQLASASTHTKYRIVPPSSDGLAIGRVEPPLGLDPEVMDRVLRQARVGALERRPRAGVEKAGGVKHPELRAAERAGGERDHRRHRRQLENRCRKRL